jgi:hypothetical protein
MPDLAFRFWDGISINKNNYLILLENPSESERQVACHHTTQKLNRRMFQKLILGNISARF